MLKRVYDLWCDALRVLIRYIVENNQRFIRYNIPAERYQQQVTILRDPVVKPAVSVCELIVFLAFSIALK